MTEKTKFEVGDDIWWLDTRSIDKPRIRFNTILEIEWEKYYSRHKYVIDDKTTYVWSPNTIVAKTKEELINILYPPKIGPFDYNQLVYVIRNESSNNLKITKAYVKGQTILSSCYKLSTIKDIKTDLEGYTSVFEASIGDIYISIDQAKKVFSEWLTSNDN